MKLKKFSALFLIFVFSAAFAAAQSLDKAGTIRVAPPSPKFSDAERQAELSARRSKTAEKMADNSMLVLFSAEPKIYAGDVDFMYRQENNLYYLTNLKQNNAMLVLTKKGGTIREFLFLPKRNPQFETWNGRMYSREEATRISGVKTVIDHAELNGFLEAVKNKTAFSSKEKSVPAFDVPETVYLLLPESEGDSDGLREFRKENEFSEALSGYKIENAQPIFAELRLVKSAFETKILQHAIDITTEAQMRSMAMVGQAKWEYEVQAEVEYTFRRRNADYWGYPSIVGCGPNATTLHYVESQGAIRKGDLLLMDVGAEYDHYTADVTRTFPVNGKFSKQQAEIYQIVYDAQEAAAKRLKPGANFRDASQAAAETIKQGLARLGLITAPNATYEILYQGKPISMPQYQLWFMHGWGHWLGMNVHDVGDYAAPLKAGMVTTNEPGIYIREDALEYIPDTPANRAFLAKVRPVFQKYKNIGVRIEDDMLITANGVEWMTKALPRTVAEIEAFMAKASKRKAFRAFEPNQNFSLSILDNDRLFFAEADDSNLLSEGNYKSGKSIRRGWIFAGKNAAFSALNHAGHFNEK